MIWSVVKKSVVTIMLLGMMITSSIAFEAPRRLIEPMKDTRKGFTQPSPSPPSERRMSDKEYMTKALCVGLGDQAKRIAYAYKSGVRKERLLLWIEDYVVTENEDAEIKMIVAKSMQMMIETIYGWPGRTPEQFADLFYNECIDSFAPTFSLGPLQ